MRKIFVLLAAGLLAVTLSGCGNGQATTAEAVEQLANPWEDVASLSEAEEMAGFEVTVPSGLAAGAFSYRYCEALNAVEIRFDDPSGYLRKAKDNGDISGDYKEYAETAEIDIDGNTVTLKGDGSDSCVLAVWTAGEYSFCIGLDKGVTASEMEAFAAGLQ